MARLFLFAASAALLAAIPAPLLLSGWPSASWSLPLVGLVGAATAVALWLARDRAHSRELSRLEERRRRASQEAADLQGLELTLLTDLEEAEAELKGHQDVAHSLATAIQHTLTAVESQLYDLNAPRLAHQIEEALELVADARDFARPSDETAPQGPVPVYAFIDATLAELRGKLEADLTWAIDDRVPDEAPGCADRLCAMLHAAVQASQRERPGAVHLEIALLDRGECRGLSIAWSGHGGDEDDFSEALGSRLSTVLGQPSLVGAQAQSLTWWMHDTQDAPAVVNPTLPSAAVLLAARQPRPRARVRRLLERWGLTVTTARSADEALLRLESRPFDIVLLDLDDETFPTLDRIREDDNVGEVPVLLLTPEADNVVWLTTPAHRGFVRSVSQEGLLPTVEAALQHRPNPHRQQSQTAQLAPRVLVMEPNPTIAATLIRAAADAGCELRVVATAEALTEATDQAWDLVLIGRQAMAPGRAAASLEDLDHRVPRLLVGPTVDGATRNAARASGLTDAAVRPADAQGLLALVSLTRPALPEASPAYSTLSATASRKPS